MEKINSLIFWNQSQLESSHFANKSAAIANHLTALIDEVDTNYPIKNYTLWNSLHGAAENITSIKDCYWNCNATKEGKVTDCFSWNAVNCTSADYNHSNRVWKNLRQIYQLGIYNSLFATFEIAIEEDGGRNNDNQTTPEAADMEITDFAGVSDRVDTTVWVASIIVFFPLTFIHPYWPVGP